MIPNRVATLLDRYTKIQQELEKPDVFRDPEKLKTLSRELHELEPMYKTHQKLTSLEKQIAETQHLLTTEKDQELISLAQNEILRLEEEQTSLQKELEKQLSVEDPMDTKPVILEIRGAAGGEEADIFADDLLRMYSRYAAKKAWEVEKLDKNVVKIKGKGVFGHLKFESGVHRVQRVPVTEAQGRVHTSTATVAVLPEVEETDVYIDPRDVTFDAFRASGHGGQNVNKVSTAVRLRHIPTGIVVECQTQRYQAQNRALAMEMLRSKLWAIQEEEKQKEISQRRRLQVGRGMRAEKIRTYNFPQNRLTDHRIGNSWHNLEEIMEGSLDPIFETLKEEEKKENTQ